MRKYWFWRFLAGSDQYPCHLSFSINLLYHLELLARFGRVTSNMNHFSFHNIRMIGMPFQTWVPTENFYVIGSLLLGIIIYNSQRCQRLDVFLFPARIWLSVVITDSKGYIITDFNHSTSLPSAISLVSLSISCVLILASKLLHSLSSHDPILTKAGNPLAQISSPWCEALPNETLLVKTVLLLLLLLCLLVCLWAPVKDAIRVHEYADGRREQYSTCTIFLLCRSCQIACTRNRLSKQILKHSRKWSTSIYSCMRSLTTARKGRYRKATLAKAILQRPFQGIHHAIIPDSW